MPLAGAYSCFTKDHHLGPSCRMSPVSVERVARFVARRMGLRESSRGPFRVYIKNNGRGWGGTSTRTGRKYITIPHWVLHVKNSAWAVYYITHEVCHLIAKDGGHGDAFKRTERATLRIFGIGIQYGTGNKYKRTYPMELYSIKTAEQLCLGSSYRITVAQTRKDHRMRQFLTGKGSQRFISSSHVPSGGGGAE